jgi:WD40 repeat protein
LRFFCRPLALPPRPFALVVLLAASAAAQEPADAKFREIWSGEPFAGSPLGVSFAKGGLVLTWGAEGRVAVWEAGSGVRRGELAGEGVTAVATSPGTRSAALGDARGAVRVIDPASGKESLRVEAGRAPVRSIRWGPTGGHLAVTTTDDVLTVWRVETGKKILENDLPKSGASDVAFSPDGARLTLVQRERTWDGRELRSSLQVNAYHLLDGGPAKKSRWDRRDADPGADPYGGARADASRGRVAIPDGNEALIWSVADDREVARVGGGADAVAWRPDGRLLVARRGELALANGESGRVEKRWRGVEGISWLATSEDGRVAVGTGASGGALWALEKADSAPVDLGPLEDVMVGRSIVLAREASGRCTAIRTSDAAIAPADADPPDPCSTLPPLAASLEGDTYACVFGGRAVVAEFGAQTAVACGEERRAPVEGVLGCEGAFVAHSATGFVILAPDGSERARGAGRPERALGRWVAVRSGRALAVWDAAAGRPAAEFHAARAFDLAGDAVAVLEDGDALVVDLASKQEIYRAGASRASAIALSAQGWRVAFDEERLAAYDARRGHRLLAADAPGPFLALRFHPDGRRLAALSDIGDFTLIEDDGSSILHTSRAFRSAGAFAFSPSGNRLALCWNDGPRLYELREGLRASVFRGAAGDVAFAPAGERWISRHGGVLDIYDDSGFVEAVPARDSAFLPDGSIAVLGANALEVRIGPGASARVSAGEFEHVAATPDAAGLAVSSGTRLTIYAK